MNLGSPVFISSEKNEHIICNPKPASSVNHDLKVCGGIIEENVGKENPNAPDRLHFRPQNPGMASISVNFIYLFIFLSTLKSFKETYGTESSRHQSDAI